MNTKYPIGLLRAVVPALVLAVNARAQVTYTDDFSKKVNYATNGVAGTIWDGVYLGAGAFAGATDDGMEAGTVSIADAGITAKDTLTVQSLQTDWENASDDGFLLFKVVTGDFDMSAQVVGPINTTAHNFPGLMVRAFGPGGSPAPNEQENYLVFGRFDEYSIANMLKNNVDGRKRDITCGKFPNSNYWMRITRKGEEFTCFEKAAPADEWQKVGSVTRTNFANLPLQVGIEHADYDGGRTLKGAYKNFSLTVNNLGPLAKAPSPVTGLAVKNDGGDLALSWSAGAGSSGSVAMVWIGSDAPRVAPAEGMSYKGNPAFGLGDTLPTGQCYVVYAGSGKKVTVTGLKTRFSYHVAVYSYAGSGKTLAYCRTPAVGEVPATSSGP